MTAVGGSIQGQDSTEVINLPPSKPLPGWLFSKENVVDEKRNDEEELANLRKLAFLQGRCERNGD
jgi:hypothetical protein